MGRKTKMERVLEKKIFYLVKIWGGNWGFTRFWTLFQGQEAENVNLRGWMKELENLSERDNEAEMENEHCGKFEGDWVRIREVMTNPKN